MLKRTPRYTRLSCTSLFLFFFNDTATTEIYTLSLHDALPISIFFICLPASTSFVHSAASTDQRTASEQPDISRSGRDFLEVCSTVDSEGNKDATRMGPDADRKSTRLNSSHLGISYAVFCFKEKTRRVYADALGCRLDPVYHDLSVVQLHFSDHLTDLLLAGHAAPSAALVQRILPSRGDDVH